MISKATALSVWAFVVAGSAGAALWLAAGGAGDSSREVDRVIGVQSGTRGTDGEQTPKPGVTQVLPTPPPPTAVRPPPPAADTAARDAARQTIEGVRGTDGSTVPPRNTVESIRHGTGSIEPINRQEGVTTPTLRNLEVVLRVQSRTPPPPPTAAGQGGGKSAATTAAKLLMLETKEPPPEEEVSDDRAIDAQFHQQAQEGS
jgi:hypothetical protein